jgi:hypothetical protein
MYHAVKWKGRIKVIVVCLSSVSIAMGYGQDGGI